MATTVHEPPGVNREQWSDSAGGGGWRNLVPADGDLHKVKDHSPPPVSTGIWVALAGITMTFAAFTSALIVRQGASYTDWQHITLPSVLYLNTLIIIASSVTLEISRRRVAAFMGGLKHRPEVPARWLYLTLSLGLLFIAGQTFAWLQLRSQGITLATNISYSFFYVLTVVHALHLLGGIGGMARVIGKFNHFALKRSTLDATSRYWHFMGVLWVYLLFLLWMKL
ncbi:MAG TPA: cytochrome c oxidase subunit 3 [Candidatus Sulfotelmatobacter sp.]|jgi:cytochrome c oxidase subunit 3